MKLRPLPLLLALAVMGSGCIVQHAATSPSEALSSRDGGSGPAGDANITFAWTFDGLSCALASVATVVVTMPGELIENAGRFPCASGSQEGITLEDFFPGTYPYTLEAYDTAGNLRYQASGTVQVDGAPQFESVTLNATADGGTPGGVHGTPPPGDHGAADAGTTPGEVDGGTATAPDGGSVDGGGAATYRYYLSWTFPDVPNAPVCGDELTQVVVTVDGAATSYDCTAGLAPAQIATPPLTLGSHSVLFEAKGADGTVWASKQISLDVTCGCHPNQTYEMPWVVGSAAVDWIFFDASHQNPTTACDVAQVDTLALNFQALDGSWLFSDAQGNRSDDTFSCEEAGGVAVYRALPPGTYSVALAGNGTCGNYLEYPGQACYQATVQAGVFLTRDAYAGSVVSVDLDHE